jgi:predicted CXXCH cytochrome family protein
VDAKTQAFTEVSLDCFTCHGDVLLEHSKAPGRALFSKKKDQPARITVSICGQCHIRTGKSRSTGRPHADNFIAGDNLFRDLKVDWSDAHLDSLGPADRHILENVRDVVILGRSKVTCLSCHEVHAQTSRKHRELDESDICANCHKPGDYTQRREYEVHSRTCGY